MREFKYKSPRVHSGELRTLVTFHEYAPNEGPLPGKAEQRTLFKAWAKIDKVWLRDLEIAKSNGTLSDVTITIRDPQAEFIPTNEHYLSIDAPEYQGKRYDIKDVQPDLQNRQFITIIAGLSE